ncbi:diaminopimelate epimerase [Boudabousia tangfeifanii]|uniref:Diaminopimelate epimerase n=1 Tax=Boudabousia tangfeifanii TaxID=1912795 RepID=A0A1D9ML20_9ACTO|nr:diaminopimelate epimerase [Boudabousia tangfeifanii]AOZ72863.1 diaminopimelate epimerase [Boudabousia tangfeifanii]
MSTNTIILYKMHGIQNDFLFALRTPELPMPTEDEIARWCHRRAGIGADGFVLVTPWELAPTEYQAQVQEAAARGLKLRWFMDYRNADGSTAEMCGNAVRCFAHILRTQQWDQGESLDGEVAWALGTRGGLKVITQVGDDYSVDMGVVTRFEQEISVRVPGIEAELSGVYLVAPNPHLVVPVSAEQLVNAQLASVSQEQLPLSQQITTEPNLPAGVNVELVVPTQDKQIKVRVYERGVGETQACGTGACAVGTWYQLEESLVEMPGGTLRIQVSPLATAVAGQGSSWEQRPAGQYRSAKVTMTGPAELVAEIKMPRS